MLGLAQTFFAQGAELLRNPGRTGGWDQVDVGLLQGIGRMSMSVAGAIRAAAQAQPTLAEQLTGDVRILDIGTGTGWLAIALAEAYPEARVVGIDIFPPALELARANVSGANLDARIELRQQDALALANTAEFSARLAPAAVPPCGHRAGRTGGRTWLLATRRLAGGGHVRPRRTGRLAELLMDLRTLRSGGRPWVADDLLPALTSVGYVDPTAVPQTWAAPVHLFLGRRAI